MIQPRSRTVPMPTSQNKKTPDQASRAQSLVGHYTFQGGEFVPHGEMDTINSKLKRMRMLAGSTETGKGEFYLDPADGSYWHFVQFEDYRAELRRVSRDLIETDFPSVDCGRALEVDS